jgi:hypothetical protein
MENKVNKKVEFEYRVNIEYNNGSFESIVLITEDIDFSMEQYSRNREPFKYSIFSKKEV